MDGGLAQGIWQKSLSKKCFWQLMPCMILRGLVEKTLITDSLFAGKKRISKDKQVCATSQKCRSVSDNVRGFLLMSHKTSLLHDD